jgi:hypothetical protein
VRAQHTYLITGVTSAVLTVTHTPSGVFGTASVPVHVTDPLTDALYPYITGPTLVQAGDDYTLALNANPSPGGSGATAWTIDWGDGTADTLVGTATSAIHVFDHPGGYYQIQATAANASGEYIAAPVSVHVAQAQAQFDISGPSTAIWSVPYEMQLISALPGDDIVSKWTIHFAPDDDPTSGYTETIYGNPSHVNLVFKPGWPNGPWGSEAYTVTAKAVDETGTHLLDTQLHVIVSDGTIDAPTGLSAIADPGTPWNRIDLTWQPVAGASYYEIIDAGGSDIIGRTLGDETYFAVMGLRPESHADYQVVAVVNGGESGPSNVAGATTAKEPDSGGGGGGGPDIPDLSNGLPIQLTEDSSVTVPQCYTDSGWSIVENVKHGTLVNTPASGV